MYNNTNNIQQTDQKIANDRISVCYICPNARQGIENDGSDWLCSLCGCLLHELVYGGECAKGKW